MGSDKNQELLKIKLKNAILIGNKATKTTPSASWKLGFHNSSSIDPNFSMKTSVSARKIGANLWEVQPVFNSIKNDGDRDPDHGGDGGGGSSSLNHHNHRPRRHHSYGKEGFKVSDQLDEEPSNSVPQPPEIKTSFRENIRGLPSLSHISVRKSDQDLQHTSSGSCCSSMQVTPYARAVTPTGYTIKTSTQLLKILNRIWNLEEQHLSNVGSIKALKRELDISRAQIKTLLEERNRDRQEIDELKRSTNEPRRKASESTRNELTEIRASFIQEKKARILLESLCDEFAKGIKDYERKVRFLQQTQRKEDRTVTENELDRLILHISEAWLDERTQMKKYDLSEKNSISDNLSCEIKTFLEAKKKQSRGFRDEEYVHETREENVSSHLVSRMMDRGSGATEPSSHLVSRIPDRGPGGVGLASGTAHEGLKPNTLMAKLLEARLESQFLKSRTIRR